MEFKKIKDIIPFTNGFKIRVCAMLLWRPKKFNEDEFDGLHYLLVDEHGSRIHAFIEECHYDHTPEKMAQGEICDVFVFSTRKDTANQKVADHEAILCFHGKTVFERVQQELPLFPNNCFHIVEFCELASEVAQQALLIDVYGYIKQIRAPEVVDVKNAKKREAKSDITIQNLGREELKITLWGQCAKTIPFEKILQKTPALALFTGMRVQSYKGQISVRSTGHTCLLLDPSIPNRKEYLAEFSKIGDKLKMIGTHMNLQSTGDVDEKELKTVSELHTLKPDTTLVKPVYSSAKIIRFAGNKRWYYRCCPHDGCFKQTRKEEPDNKYFCQVHGLQVPKNTCKVTMIVEDDEDQADLILVGKAAEEFFGISCDDLLAKRFYPTETTIPIEILSKIGMTCIFELRVSYLGDLYVRNVIEKTARINETQHDRPLMDTPEKLHAERKRDLLSSSKTLFRGKPEKKFKLQDGSTSSSLTKEEQDLLKKND